MKSNTVLLIITSLLICSCTYKKLYVGAVNNKETLLNKNDSLISRNTGIIGLNGVLQKQKDSLKRVYNVLEIENTKLKN